MKINRRRSLFYHPRRSNLYRIFALVLVILAGIWLATRLDAGVLRNPFAPTLTPTRLAGSYSLEGDAFFAAGDLDRAIASYQDAVKVDPNNAEVWAKLARIQAYSSRLQTTDAERFTRLEEARNSIQQAVALAPDDSTVHAIYAFVLDWCADPNLDSLRSGNETAADLLIQAESEALRSLSLDSHNPLALAFYAEILVDQQKWLQADQYIQQALQRGPDIMDVHRAYAYVLESTAQYNQAIVEYQRALEINPNLTFLYINIGTNYRQLAFDSDIESQQRQLYGLALDNFDKAARLNQQLGIKDPLPYIAIAKTYSQQGDFFAAERNALKAIEFRPTDADLYGKLGIIYQKARNFESAIPALACAVVGCGPETSCQARFARSCQGNEGVSVEKLDLSPGTVVYYYTYGSVLAALSRPQQNYCPDAVTVLGQVQSAYGSDPIIAGIVSESLQICDFLQASNLLTPTPASSPTALPTPRSIPTSKPPPTPRP